MRYTKGVLIVLNVNEVLTRPDVVLDFWAPWCKPCLALAPILDHWDQQGLIPIVRANVDEQPMIAQQFGVQGLPTMIHLQKGREVSRVVGQRPESELKRVLQLPS